MKTYANGHVIPDGVGAAGNGLQGEAGRIDACEFDM